MTYFYFDFNDAEKQQSENLVRSLIVQLSAQSSTVPDALNALYSKHHDGQQQPSNDAFVETLQHICMEFQEIFIVLDALDECKDREELLRLISEIYEWKTNKLHVLATSRREKDITEALEALITEQISIQDEVDNADIHTHICERLQNDPKLNKWSAEIKTEIETRLMNDADGMLVTLFLFKPFVQF